MMKSRRRSRPPPSSSHAPSNAPPLPINIDELSSLLGLPDVPRSHQSHISFLPPEILAEIFVYCIPQERFCSTAAPLRLSHVSHYWRTLALALPELWSSVHFSYRNAVEDVPAIQTYLARSGDRPLALSIAIDFAEEPQEDILTVLQRHSKRWKHVRFDFRHLLCPAVYSLQQALGNVPQLETFEFHAKDISNVNIAPVTQLLQSAPRLREVSWVDDLADVDTLLQLPLARLTHLSLSIEHDTLDYLQVLQACSNLEHIRLTRPSARSRAPAVQAQPPLALAKLTSLNLSADMLGILDSLVLPALTDVRIYSDHRRSGLPRAPSGHTATYLQPTHTHAHGHAHPYTSGPSSQSSHREAFDATALLSLIDRSRCAITSLSVKGPMAEEMLIRCLRRTSSSLVRLSVNGASVGDKLLQVLSWKHHHGSDSGHSQPRQGHHGPLRYVSLEAPANRKGEGGLDGVQADHDVELDGAGEDGGRLCPKLEELELDTRVVSSHGLLASMIESRVVICSATGTQSLGGECPSSVAVDERGRSRVDSEVLSPLRKLRVVDGHRDLERLKELSVLSRKHRCHNACASWGPGDVKVRAPMRRAWTDGSVPQAGVALGSHAPLTLVVTAAALPKTMNTRMGGMWYRRKPCASR